MTMGSTIRAAAVAAAAIMIGVVASPLAASEPGDRSGVWVDLNIPALKLVVYDGDRVLRAYPVAVGKLGHDTPTGQFEISHAEWNPWWHPPTHRPWAANERVTPPGPNNPMGRVKMFFSPMYFIHGSPEHGSIGTAASHGCVRMLNDDAIELGKLLHEQGNATLSSEQIARVLRNQGNTTRSSIRAPIPLVVRYDPVEVVDGELVIYPDIYERNRIHTESVFQALAAAGVETTGLSLGAVREMLERLSPVEETVRVPLGEVLAEVQRNAPAFGG
jgi:murein L,D-transpeptidase YcbB/YkuD